jgi:TetR/AcrR family transcriptional regulator, transcriptional repressor for nem operon
VTGRVKVSDGLSPKALRRLQDTGGPPAEVSVDQLATGLLAALQGGYMLAQTERDVAPMATSIDMALAHIESLSTVRAKALGRRSLT